MRIDGPNRLPSPAASDADAAPPRRSQAPSPRPGDGDAVIIAPELQRYVRQAGSCEEVRADAVAEARRLIDAGELDTPEAMQRAAERILTEGL